MSVTYNVFNASDDRADRPGTPSPRWRCYAWLVTQPVRRPPIYDDIVALPDNVVGEILDGGHLWLVDPQAQTLEVFRLDAAGWVLVVVHGERDVVRAPLFEDVPVRLDRLWGVA
jgi:hypothetical protein